MHIEAIEKPVPPRKREAAAALPAAARLLNAGKVYGQGENRVVAVDGVTLEFAKGRFTAIMGPSGSGKSTMMHCAAGLDTLTTGRAFVGGVDLTELDDAELTLMRRERVGFVFQAYNLVPALTAAENITLTLDLSGRRPNPDRYATIVDVLQLAGRLSHRPSELSGGEQQRVAVARALVSDPELVFADEPTGNLDSRSGALILEFLRRTVRETGQTIVMVTHDPSAASYADRVVFVSDGRIVDDVNDPTAEDVLERMHGLGR